MPDTSSAIVMQKGYRSCSIWLAWRKRGAGASASKKEWKESSISLSYKHQVANSGQVDRVSKVLVVATREACADAVVGVHHGGDAVEAEAVELVLFHVEAEVAEQEAEDLVVIVVEEAAVPELVSAFDAAVEVLVVCAVELVQAVVHILTGVGVDHVEQDGDAHAVGGVNEFFQLFGCACV